MRALNRLGRYLGWSLALAWFACSSGEADKPALELLANLKLNGNVADVWGYFDDETGKEYALVGFGLFESGPGSGVHIVEVTDPENPALVASVTEVPGFDVKVWRHYLYSVIGTNVGDGGIVDISDPANPRVVGSFPSSHNIFISENGYLYSACPGLTIYDLNPDPTKPQVVWTRPEGGCHDSAVIGTRLYDFAGGAGTNIYDVSDPTNPVLLGTAVGSSVVFHHSGWVSEDGDFLYICDEGARHPIADITVWDIRDASQPKFVSSFADSGAIVHNLIVRGGYAYTSYYTAGFRVFDLSDPSRLTQIAEFDTSPLRGETFAGALGVYPLTRSGLVFVSDMQQGLFVFRFNGAPSSSLKIMAP